MSDADAALAVLLALDLKKLGELDPGKREVLRVGLARAWTAMSVEKKAQAEVAVYFDAARRGRRKLEVGK